MICLLAKTVYFWLFDYQLAHQILKLDSVVIDLVLEERNLCCANILLWDRPEFHPYTNIPESKPLLKIGLLASKPRKSFEAKMKAIYESTTRVKECFEGIDFTYPDYNSSTDSVNKQPNISIVNSIADLTDGNHLRLNVACLALRPDWLSILEATPHHESWLKSGQYEGISELAPEMESAIHCCGLYTMTQEFSSYIAEVWQPIVQKYAITSDEMNPIQMLHKALEDPTFANIDVSLFKDNLLISDLFSNHDGPYENRHYDGVALRRLQRNPDLVIGISKHLFRELETIDISYSEYRKSVRLFFKENEI